VCVGLQLIGAVAQRTPPHEAQQMAQPVRYSLLMGANSQRRYNAARSAEPSIDEVRRTFAGAGVAMRSVCFERLSARRR
jgi:hypothetical protein